MNRTLIRADVRRFLRSPDALFFTIVIPTLMYIIFGGSAEYGDNPIGHGNINMVVLINMSVYALSQAAVGYTGTTAIDQLQGWGRQLALTPLTATSRLLNQVIAAFLISTITLVCLQVVGVAMGAQIPVLRFIAFCTLSYLTVALFACYGIAVVNTFKAETSISIASGLLVLLAFAGNLFAPLSGTLLTISRFTPLWGLGELARYPLTEGLMYDSSGIPASTPLWYALVNVAAWLLIFVVWARLSVRRANER
ncbi:ABC transporter permease [Arcanobacterium phocisimile]|uniref:ABC transporter permease n=1 Tax=Arcanobacterium phocisimile TaxID=1302235 RepID=A0ABX7IHF8_9ACTO|nr:ABC transporter permease [Arcanobacterium phocisimile]QRV01989.1 ABC transporter permease [Arcanobacterium phocisimile]